MIKLLVGNKGSGKTKALINLVNNALATTKGDVVVIEKGATLTFDISHKARLIDIEDYCVRDFKTLGGFISGLLAGNYDITEMFIDGTLRIGDRDTAKLSEMLLTLDSLVEKNNVNLYLTISCPIEELPQEIHKYTTAF